MTPETHSAAIQAAQHFTGQYLPLEPTATKRRADPAQWIRELNGEPKFPALELVTRPNLKTEEAAYYLNRRPQTLRAWAMRDGIEGLRPKRIAGILAWNTLEVKALAGVAV